MEGVLGSQTIEDAGLEKGHLPSVGLAACNSASSNSGSLAGLAAIRVAKEFPSVGILSLPALANGVPRQVRLARRIASVVAIDGCKNSCASRILSQVGVKPAATVSLEEIGITKIGPFTTFKYSEEDLDRMVLKLREVVSRLARAR